MIECEIELFYHFEEIDTVEFHDGGFRIAVRDRRILTHLANYIDVMLGREGYMVSEIHRPVGLKYGLLFIAYISPDRPHDEIPREEVSRLSRHLGSTVDQFFDNLYYYILLSNFAELPSLLHDRATLELIRQEHNTPQHHQDCHVRF